MEVFSIRKVLLKNMGFQSASQLLSLGLSLISTAVLSRYLGVDAFGQFSYVYAFYYIFLVLNDFGIDPIVIREVSQNKDRAAAIVGTMRTYKLAGSLILLLVAWTSITLMHFQQPLEISLYVFGLILPVIALQLPITIFHVQLKMQYPSVIGFINRVLNFAITMVFVALGYKLKALIFGMIACEIFSLLAIYLFSRQFVKPLWTFDWSICKTILKSSIPIGITGIFVAIINRSDFVMLERMVGIHEVGLYASIYKITNLVESLPLMIMATIYPLMSRYSTEDPVRLRRIYAQGSIFLLGSGFLAGLTICLLAPYIMRALYGNQYMEAVPGLRILIWATVFLYWALLSGNLLISLKKERINLIFNIIAAILNIVLNYLLIPKWGFKGAAFTTAVSFFVLMVGLGFFAIKNIIRMTNAKQSS